MKLTETRKKNTNNATVVDNSVFKEIQLNDFCINNSTKRTYKAKGNGRKINKTAHTYKITYTFDHILVNYSSKRCN